MTIPQYITHEAAARRASLTQNQIDIGETADVMQDIQPSAALNAANAFEAMDTDNAPLPTAETMHSPANTTIEKGKGKASDKKADVGG